jgi:hypothetical protein
MALRRVSATDRGGLGPYPWYDGKFVVKVQGQFTLEVSAGPNVAPADHGADVEPKSALDCRPSSAATYPPMPATPIFRNQLFKLIAPSRAPTFLISEGKGAKGRGV